MSTLEWWWQTCASSAMPIARHPACSAPARLPGGPGRGSGVGRPALARAPPKKKQSAKNGHRFDLGTCFDSAHCSRHLMQSTLAGARNSGADSRPASARKASASRHRPASGFCKHWRASTAPGRARAATAGTFRRVTFCCGPGAHSRPRRRRARLLDSLLRSAQSMDY